jgi:hypothetical protein
VAGTYYVVVDHDENGEAVCKLTGPNPTLDALADAGQMARWSFFHTRASGRRYLVNVYQSLSVPIAQGEQFEELRRRVVDCIVKNPEVEPDKPSLWGGRLFLGVLITALVIANLGSRVPAVAVAVVVFFCLGSLYAYYSRHRNKRT